MQTELSKRQNEIDSLKAVAKTRERFSDESVRVSPEVKVLFPNVKDIALANMVASAVGSTNENAASVDTLCMIFVNAPGGLTNSERNKLTDYMEVRLGQKKMHLTVNPANFPWPSRQSAK